MQNSNQNKIVSRWLFICCFFVVLMVVIGGLTRLTDSGLSMTDWRPVHGTIPPLNAVEWQEEFNAYKKSPEYQKINFGMELSEFKKIFLWEYIHRLAGRITGLVFLLPLIFFAVKGYISKVQAAKLMGVFVIGGLQAIIGWWMVKSGLYDRPSVSHFRLAIHLSFAFLIFSIIFWQALNFSLKTVEPYLKLNNYINILLSILILQIVYGAFVAGLDAGKTYNTWPLMDGDFAPAGFAEDGFQSLFQDITSIQFIHRWLAFVFLASVIVFFIKVRSDLKEGKIPKVTDVRFKKATNMLLAVTLLQIIIGIKTLIMVVPISLASIHQLMALVILANLVFIKRVSNG